MKLMFSLFKLIIQIIIFNAIFTNVNAINFNKSNSAENISNYFSGIVSLNDNNYYKSYSYFKDLKGLENKHFTYSQLYIFTLINNNKIIEAFNYVKKLEKKNIKSFEGDIIKLVYYLKKNEIELAQKSLFTIKKNQSSSKTGLQKLLINSIDKWLKLKTINFHQAKSIFETKENKLNNLNKIQNVFLYCYYQNENTENMFNNLVKDNNTDFSRYYFFYLNYLNNINTKKTYEILEEALTKNPRSLAIQQFKKDLNKENKNDYLNNFNCNNIAHIIAEIFYITANALSTQSLYANSNFYLNLAKFLNEDFKSYETLYAENFYMTKNYKLSKNLYKKISNFSEVYHWYASKQISSILLKEEKKNEAINFLKASFEKLSNPSIYEIYDYANFLKNNEKYSQSIKLYSNVLNKINNDHNLYSKATDGRGIAYERVGEWSKAEKDFLNSLEANPNQAYVLNYLAYSWLEKGIKIEESLKMLEKANDLRKNDGYITDSLGWALFKLKKYPKANEILQEAVRLMPSDPVINDHFGDTLWMIGKKIQARYYWKYVLSLEKTEDDLRKKINKKLIFGLQKKS